MKQLLFLFAVMAFTLSCSENDPVKNTEEETGKGILQISCFYTTESNRNVQIPDAQSKVFIYYGYYSLDFAGFSYQEEGKLIKGDAIVFPDQNAVIEADGKAVIQLEQVDKPFTFLVESNHYKRITLYSYSEWATKEKIVCTFIFYP